MSEILIFVIENNFHYHYAKNKWYSTMFKYNELKDKKYITNYYSTQELIQLKTKQYANR